MTNAFLQEFDVAAHAAFADAGMADVGTYTPAAGGAAVPNVRVLIDRSVETIGEQSDVIAMRATVTCFAADIGARPRPGARFRVGSETFTVDELDRKTDESRYVCIVKEGA